MDKVYALYKELSTAQEKQAGDVFANVWVVPGTAEEKFHNRVYSFSSFSHQLSSASFHFSAETAFIVH